MRFGAAENVLRVNFIESSDSELSSQFTKINEKKISHQYLILIKI